MGNTIADFIQEQLATNAGQDADFNKVMNARVGEASVTSLLWGKIIPITYGKRRVTGQVIQLGERKQSTETKFNYSSGAMSGGVTYENITTDAEITHKATFGVTFGAPGIPTSRQILTKLWVNKTLVYDIAGGFLSPTLNFKFYQGSEDQLPDEVMNLPFEFKLAYRGLMYAAIYDYTQVMNVANGLTAQQNPNIEAEIMEELINTQTVETYETLDGGPSDVDIFNQSTMFDSRKGFVYTMGGDNQIYRYSVRDRAATDAYPIQFTGVAQPAGYLGFYGKTMGFTQVAGVNLIVGQCTNSNSNAVYLIEADTGNVIAVAGVSDSQTTPDLTHIGLMNNVAASESGGKTRFYVTTIFRYAAVIDVTSTSIEIVSASDTDYGTDLRFSSGGGRFGFIGDGVNLHLIDANLAQTTNWYTMPYEIANAIYQPYDDTVVLMASDPTDQFDWEIRKVHMVTKETIWSRVSADYEPIRLHHSAERWRTQSFSADRVIGWSDVSGSNVAVVNMVAGSVEVYDRDNSFNDVGIYDAYTNRLIAPTTGNDVTDFPIVNPSTDRMPLSALLQNLAERQGYDTGDIIVENIDDIITGAAITQKSDLSAMLNDLRQAYNFTIIKRGRTIRFSRRVVGSSFTVDATITEANRAILSEDDDAFITVKSQRADVVKVPGTITLRYIDPDLDYIQSEITHVRNDEYSDAASTLTLTIPVIITASEAMTLATRITSAEAEGAMEHELLLGQKYTYLEQGDYLRLVFSEYEDVVRIDRIDYNGDKSIKCITTVMNFAATPVYTAEELPPFENPPTVLEGASTALVFDTPLLVYRDQTTDPTLETYFSLASEGRTAISGGTVIKAAPNGAKEPVGQINATLTYGFVRGDLNGGLPWTIDYQASMSFRLSQGDPAKFVTDTRDNVLLGYNRILVGNVGRWEMIGFIEADYDATTKLITLTGLIRGLRGTDVNVNNHQPSDYIVYVDDAVNMSPQSVETLGDSAVWMGQSFAGVSYFAEGTNFLQQGNSRRPFAPSAVHATLDGSDIDITWARRTRLYGPLIDGTPDVPLDEASELYELDIYRAGSIVRTITALTSPAYTYTAAQQVTDGWSGDILSIRLDIYQISDIVGRGFAKSGTFNVE